MYGKDDSLLWKENTRLRRVVRCNILFARQREPQLASLGSFTDEFSPQPSGPYYWLQSSFPFASGFVIRISQALVIAALEECAEHILRMVEQGHSKAG